MKYLVFVIISDMAKLKEVAAASDKFWANPPPGLKMSAVYGCLGNPFPTALPEKCASISVCLIEASSHELLLASTTPAWLAGQTVYAVPVVDMPTVGLSQALGQFGLG